MVLCVALYVKGWQLCFRLLLALCNYVLLFCSLACYCIGKVAGYFVPCDVSLLMV